MKCSALILSVLVLAIFTISASAFENVKFSTALKFEGSAVTLNGELSKPDGAGPFPAVVLMHGCGGWMPAAHRSLREHARILVEQGFVALNLDSFGPREIAGGWVCKSIDRLGAARFYRTVDAFSALNFLQTKPFVDAKNIFLMGRSNGGSVTIKAALKSGPQMFGELAIGSVSGPFRAAVAYYPWCGYLEIDGTLDFASPLLVFGGGRDDWVSPVGCKRLEDPEKGLEVVVYPDAVHSFDLDIEEQKYLGHLLGYNEHATEDSRRRMVAFFKRHMTDD